MERFYVFVPALVPTTYMVSMFAYFCIRSALGRQPTVEGLRRRKFTEIFGPFLTAYILWLLRPIERAFVVARVPPNAITTTSLLLCAISGFAVATGHLATAAWVYICAGLLDILDGRLARATNRSSPAGAFLDSVSDRWGELLVFSGLIWFLRTSPWLGAAMLALAGSVMVSYTRARGEGLDLKLDGGTMQRAERITLVSVGTLIAAWFNGASDTVAYVPHIVGAALLLTGVGSTVTALGRWMHGYKTLKAREQQAKPDGHHAPPSVEQPVTPPEPKPESMPEATPDEVQGSRVTVDKPASQMVIASSSKHQMPAAGDVASIR